MEESYLSFNGLGIAPKLIGTLLKLQFKHPTPIQRKVIPSALEGKDVIGIAQTGTGKTMAFGIPLIQRLAGLKGRALVLVPTRELALQVEESILKISRAFGLRTVALIGGESIGKQIRDLERQPRIIIATPGRLIDLAQQRKVRLADIAILVLDEADRMFDMGFAPQVKQILKDIPMERQTMLFSATMPVSIVRMTSAYMNIPVQVEVAPAGTAAEGVTHELFIVRRENKKELLKKLLDQYRGSVLLFCRTKNGTSRVARSIEDMGHKTAAIHSDRSLGQRKEALEGFRAGKYRVLAATDIAARGIDVAGIELIINYDLPDDAENYVHRVGRTGRAGGTGHAITFAAPEQRGDVVKIEQLIKTVLPISQHADITAEKFDKPQQVFSYSRSAAMRRGRFPSRRR
jgi:ATP-dependent RNA helicase RhlE